MKPITITAIIAGCTVAAALLGMFLRVRLPDHHLREDSSEAVKLVTGLIATLAALVLGLLIASAKNFYDTQNAEMQTLSAKIVNLDQVLVRYGPETVPARAALRAAVVAGHDRLWPAHGTPTASRNPGNEIRNAGFYALLQNLTPVTDPQRHLLAQATDIADAISETRLLIFEQVGNSIAWPFLFILVFWLVVMFLGFGLLSPPNPTVIAALAIGSLAVASATFLILEMDQPYIGLIRLPDTPLRDAILQITP
jgi:hypothetical protein